MSTLPEIVELGDAISAIGAKQGKIEGEIELLKQQLQASSGIDGLAALQQQLADLQEERRLVQRQLTALQEERMLLVKQQTDAAAAAAAAETAATAAGSGAVILYKDVVLHIPGGGNSTDEFVRPYVLVSRASLQKVLDMQGCDAVLTPDTKQLVSFDAIELHDNMVLTALRISVPWDARVFTLEGFMESSVKGFEEDATEAVFQHLQQEHSSAKVLPIRNITSVDGKKREVDAAVVADGCAAILKAKQVLDDSAVPQLASCIEFIRNNELVGPAAELKGKKLLGFLAGRRLSSDPDKAQALVRDCRQHGYGIFVSNGRSLGLGNSRVPHLRVNCAMYKRACGASSCAVRMV